MPRSELDPRAVAQLAALDQIIAGEPVGEEHLELAALVDSVRASSPTLDATAQARLDARVRGARSRRTAESPRRQRVRLRPGRLALAGGPLVAVVVAVAVVLGSGALNGSAPRSIHPPAAGAGGSAPGVSHSGAVNGALPAYGVSAPTGTTGGASSSPALTLPAVTPVQRKTTSPLPNTNPSHRLVARGASLTLAAAPDQIQTVANEVVASTEHVGGIVESSNVAVHGMSSFASFSLSVPSVKLAQLIASLSSLSAVRSLDQAATDITSSYDAAAQQLADERAQRSALIKALAAASTLAAEQSIQHKINGLDTAIAAATHHIGVLRSRGDNAKVSLEIVASRAAAGGAGGAGPVGRALNDALSVLDVALAIALVALAIVLPVALVVFALWWASATLRQRSRERALAASAAASS